MSDGHLSNVTRRGNISQRVQCLSASGIRRFFDILDGMKDVISLGVGQPDFVTPAVIRNAAIKSIEDGQTHYTSNYGIIELRQAISRHLQHHYDVFYEPATEIIVTTGVSEGLNIAMQTLRTSATRCSARTRTSSRIPPASPSPTASSSPCRRATPTPSRSRPEAIEERITPRTKAILIGYPSNPTGAVMEREDLLAVAELAEKHNLFVISDEIYDRLVYGMKHTCFASLPGMQQRTILLGGFSKAYAMTGWRLGYAAAPANILEA